MAQDDNATTDQEQAGQPGGLTPDDLYELRAASDVQAFPDGRRTAYVVTQMDREKNTYRSAIWICSTAGVAPARQFTNGLDRDTMPRLSPDGAWLAFLSTRACKPQIWVMPVDGGEARQVTRAKHGAAEIAWAPDSRRLAYTSAVGGPDDDEKKDDDPQKPAPTRVITRLRYKQDGAGLILCRVGVNESTSSGQRCRRRGGLAGGPERCPARRRGPGGWRCPAHCGSRR